MAVSSALRVPGVYFLPPPIAPGTPLPPLDVAAFVGFAERGPLDRPVALDDYADYRAVFGGDLPLARDDAGVALSAFLPASVGAFFSNGGRRCYVVRIAGESAGRARLPLTGILRLNEFGLPRPAEIETSSEGAWASKLHIATRLRIKYIPLSALSDFRQTDAGFTLLWDTGGTPENLLPGEIVRLAFADTPQNTSLLMLLSDVRPAPGGSANQRLLVSSTLWQAEEATGSFPIPVTSMADHPKVTRAERLRFDLVLRETGQPQQTVSDLAFNAPHPRFWGDVALLESSLLFRPGPNTTNTDSLLAADRYRALQQEVRDLRAIEVSPGIAEIAGRLAPLSDAARADTYLPTVMPAVLAETDFLGVSTPGSDDLATFPADRFLDAWLTAGGSDAASLYQNAQDRYWVQGRRLRGLHSLMFVDEVALIALPDSIHPDWKVEEVPPNSPPNSPPAAPVEPAPQPDKSLFVTCDVQDVKKEDAVTSPPAAPKPLLPLIQPDAIFNGNGDPVEALRFSSLVTVQAELQKFCEARHDVEGVLTLPGFYERRHCRMWLRAFRERLGLPLDPSVFNDTEDLPDLSYVAVYHPWIQVADGTAPNRLRAVPGEGAICGTIAARERARGVWIAPANQPLGGVLGLTPRISESDRADLFEVGFNILHAEPRDFRAMSAHTLSDERIWLQVSVRRLMILLRKMLLELGDQTVFENNDAHFREGVRITIEGVLQTLFQRGAFAGKSAALSYRIATGADVNPQQSVDEGRFIAEVRVAPSQPAEFITVQLVRTNDNLLTAREV